MNKIKDKKELMKLCSFIVMGDGGVYQNNSKRGNFQFIMNMKEENEDYMLLCKDILENITPCRLYQVQKEGNRKPQLRLESRFHPYFTLLRERIYTGDYKGIDPHALKLLDYEALSFLYMSDGSFQEYFRPEIKMINLSYKVTLNMKRLSYGDQFILKKALKDNLDLEWNINRQNKYFYLNLRLKDFHKFMNGISPYITPSFHYKLLNGMPQ